MRENFFFFINVLVQFFLPRHYLVHKTELVQEKEHILNAYTNFLDSISQKLDGESSFFETTIFS